MFDFMMGDSHSGFSSRVVFLENWDGLMSTIQAEAGALFLNERNIFIVVGSMVTVGQFLCLQRSP